MQVVLGILNGLLKILQVHRLEEIDLLNTEPLLSQLGISNLLGLKLLADGDLLYVNLLGLRVGVSLVTPGEGSTGTAVVTIGDSSVELPYDENGFNADNPEAVVNLIKGNRTKVENCTVTGIPIGYDVYGGGAYNDRDGTAATGYSGGFFVERAFLTLLIRKSTEGIDFYALTCYNTFRMMKGAVDMIAGANQQRHNYYTFLFARCYAGFICYTEKNAGARM